MGTINYKTMEYITLAIRPYDFEDIKAGILEDIESGNYEEYTQEDIIDDFVYDTINEYYSCDSENAKSIINNYYSLWTRQKSFTQFLINKILLTFMHYICTTDKSTLRIISII